MVELHGTLGPDGADQRLLVLYAGGTIGMTENAAGSLEPLDLRDLARHLPVLDRLPVQITLAAFDEPIDSAAIEPGHWIAIADAIIEHAAGHVGVVVLHGTDTMAYTASALSFLLAGVNIPIVLTGAQRPVTSMRSDGRENLVTAAAIAQSYVDGSPVVPEVTIFFDDVLLRGNRATKVNADSYRGFATPNLAPLATAGVTIDFARTLIRPPDLPPLHRRGGLCTDVASIRLHPGLDQAGLAATLSRPHLRGLVLEAYGSGNGPNDAWFLDAIGSAVDAGVLIVTITQCRAGSVRGGKYATGAALQAAGAVPGGDMTFEAALTKLMVLLDRYEPDMVRTLVPLDLAGEITTEP